MLLAIDIGNTNIVVGAFDTGGGAGGGTPVRHWRLSTARERTADEYGVTILNLFAVSGMNKDAAAGAIISCVVPSLRETFRVAMENYFMTKPLFVEPGMKTGMPILTDDPREVGADRIVNAVGAYSKHRCELIVVDFGTATTFDHVTAKGEYSGGAIAPGIGVSSDALFKRAARLPKVEPARPSSVIGRNTVDSVRSGLYYGYVSLVDGMVGRIKKECAGKPRVIATGGYAGLIAADARTIDEVDELLVLKGLRRLYEVNAQ